MEKGNVSYSSFEKGPIMRYDKINGHFQIELPSWKTIIDLGIKNAVLFADFVSWVVCNEPDLVSEHIADADAAAKGEAQWIEAIKARLPKEEIPHAI